MNDDDYEWIEEMVANITLKSDIFTKEEIAHINYTKKRAAVVGAIFGENKSIVIGGGCFASWFTEQPIKDIDVFVLDDPADQAKIRDSMKKSFYDIRNTTEDYVRENKFVSEVWNSDKSQIQVIFTKYKTREELIKHFDYLHCTVTYNQDKLYITRKAYDAIMNKYLVVNNKDNLKKYREEKFLGRGYRYKPELESAY